MKSRISLCVLAALLSGSFLGLGGCASTQSASADVSSAGGDTVVVTLLSESEVRSQYGRTPSDDPFLMGSHTLFGKGYDFIALQLTAASAGGASLEILQAEAQDEKGKVRAKFYDKQSFTDLVTDLSFDPTNISTRQNKISWYYLPEKRMHLDRGKSTYVMILVGDHPLPSALTAGVRLLLNGQEQDFSLPVPDTN
jgi:hypothetical protein